MTAHPERDYFFDEEASTIWYTDDEDRQPAGCLFLGSSINPNPKVAGTMMVRTNRMSMGRGYHIKELP